MTEVTEERKEELRKTMRGFLDSHEDRLVALAKALEPFARIKADDGDTFDRYPDSAIIRCEVTAGDLRAAREALK